MRGWTNWVKLFNQTILVVHVHDMVVLCIMLWLYYVPCSCFIMHPAMVLLLYCVSCYGATMYHAIVLICTLLLFYCCIVYYAIVVLTFIPICSGSMDFTHVPGGGTMCPRFPILIFQSNEKISLLNFQEILLWVSKDDLSCQGWPFPPNLQSRTINLLKYFFQQY